MRKKIIAGNWKMNNTITEATELVNSIKDGINTDEVDVVLCPNFVSLSTVSDLIDETKISLGAQNVYFEDKGAYTGETSVDMLISAGVKSFKIEGRMKSPEYVGLVTSIYRKYIDLANSSKPYIVDQEDREKLMQIFNRGGFSTGYLKGKLGKEMMYKYRPNHIGIHIGTVEHYNPNKGYAKVKLTKELSLGDSISIKDGTCKISELMIVLKN